jgi:uncharacterized protein YgfB (UPF0149 family)
MSCDYATLAGEFSRVGILMTPAEAQGMAFALVSAQVRDANALWEQLLLSDVDTEQLDDCRAALDELYTDAERQLAADDFTVRLCLPAGDQASAMARASALRDWCRGYLYGLGLAGQAAFTALGAEARDAVHDLNEIAQLDAAGVQGADADEAALVELEEYLRVVLVAIRDDLRQPTRSADEPE